MLETFPFLPRCEVLIAAGSNLGDRGRLLERARTLLNRTPGLDFLQGSRVRETRAEGGPVQGDYLNAVWCFETDLQPKAILYVCRGIERALGRVRRELNGPRTMDLDLLAWGESCVRESGLEIPHPRLQERFFVLEPLCDIRPRWRHPVLGKSAAELLEELREAYSPA